MSDGIMNLPITYVCPTCGMKHYGRSSEPVYCLGWHDAPHEPAAVVPEHETESQP